jgi:hypothetical protein
MPFDSIIWDLDDDPDGNVQHCGEHGVTTEEVEEVFQNATDGDISRSCGRPVVFRQYEHRPALDGSVRRNRR